MSELIIANGDRNIRRHLLTSASAMAILACACLTTNANADDSDRPTVWIELGGQLESVSGVEGRFIEPFMLKTPVPGPFSKTSPIDAQHSARYAIGGEAKITFEPRNTNWVFSAALRYGRSTSNKNANYQTSIPLATPVPAFQLIYTSAFSSTHATPSESHAIVDFRAGKDVGLGMFGHGSQSDFNVGIRFAQFTSKTSVTIHARPDLTWFLSNSKNEADFHAYNLIGDSERSFHGVGPSLSWDASAPFAGNPDNMEFDVDWGVNAAVLFGRQKARVHHTSSAYHFRGNGVNAANNVYALLYRNNAASTRSRSVIVPNIGGFAGLTAKFPNAKVSLGYRADFFFGAMDTGIDSANRTTTSFHGPYSIITIGLGG